jgi:hypothetical protein
VLIVAREPAAALRTLCISGLDDSRGIRHPGTERGIEILEDVGARGKGEVWGRADSVPEVVKGVVKVLRCM